MTDSLPGTETVRDLLLEVRRTRLRARNGIRLLTGSDGPNVAPTPKDEVWSSGKVTLYRYRSDRVSLHPPLLIFVGLVSRPYILDLRRGNSFIERLVEAGFDVFLLDWGVPDAAEGDHTLETYVEYYLPRAIDATGTAAAADEVTFIAYCMGAFLGTLLLGSRSDLPVRGWVALTPLVDMTGLNDAVLPLLNGAVSPAELIDEETNLVPAATIKTFFRLRKPTSEIVQYVNLWENLWKEGHAQAHQAMAQWVWDHIPFPGPAWLQFATDYVQANALMTGQARIAGRSARLEDIDIPTLIVTAQRDELVPPACSAPMRHLIGAEDLEVSEIPAGHIGLIMGRSGAHVSIPAIIDWLARHSSAVA